jgi:hypothetical protein
MASAFTAAPRGFLDGEQDIDPGYSSDVGKPASIAS